MLCTCYVFILAILNSHIELFMKQYYRENLLINARTEYKNIVSPVSKVIIIFFFIFIFYGVANLIIIIQLSEVLLLFAMLATLVVAVHCSDVS